MHKRKETCQKHQQLAKSCFTKWKERSFRDQRASWINALLFRASSRVPARGDYSLHVAPKTGVTAEPVNRALSNLGQPWTARRPSLRSVLVRKRSVLGSVHKFNCDSRRIQEGVKSQKLRSSHFVKQSLAFSQISFSFFFARTLP